MEAMEQMSEGMLSTVRAREKSLGALMRILEALRGVESASDEIDVLCCALVMCGAPEVAAAALRACTGDGRP